MVTEETFVQVKRDLAIAELGDEAVILDGDTSHYYGLNQVGFRVLQLSKESRLVSEIIDRILEEYEVGRDQLKEDVLTFLREMEELDLIVAKSGLASQKE